MRADRSLLGLRKQAEENYDKWRVLAFDRTALAELNKTQDEAIQLANYFEGQLDAFVEAIRLAGSKSPPTLRRVANGYQPRAAATVAAPPGDE